MSHSERAKAVGIDEPVVLHEVDGSDAVSLLCSRSLEDHNTEADNRIKTYGEKFRQYHAENSAKSLANALLEEENQLKGTVRSASSKKKKSKKKKRRNVHVCDAHSIPEHDDVDKCLVKRDESDNDLCDTPLQFDDETSSSNAINDTKNTTSLDSDGEDAYADALTGIEFCDNDKEVLNDDLNTIIPGKVQITKEEKVNDASEEHNWEPAVYSSSRHRSARRQSRRQSRSWTLQSEISCDSSDTLLSSSDFDYDDTQTVTMTKTKKKVMESIKTKHITNKTVATQKISKPPPHPDHQQDRISIATRKKYPFAIVREVEFPSRSQTSILHDDLKEMADMLEMVAQRRRPWQLAVAERIKAAVGLLFPGGIALVFGSLASGLAAPCSDVDMVVRSYGTYTPQQALHLLAEHLGCQEWVQMLEAIHHTPVPVIRLGTACIPVSFGSQVSGSLIAVDITFETITHHGLRTCDVVKGFVSEYPPLKPLTLVLKQFLVEKGLNDPFVGGLSSYGLVLMIVNMFKLRYPQGLNSNVNLGTLFIEFLDLYKIPTFTGQRVSMQHLAPGVPLYIQDPIDPMNNIGRSCFGIHQVIQAFAEAHDAIQVSAIPSEGVDW
eukprot:CAMPEP_0204832682 /NCGR_PEP_ID=MMETSP1346-20131115/14416_1 /ASSEMBLY_ACC=CAM_ASM_000771 /TAXON_ID=215587 /ORGANISM="Aplanochytrium stocchinoi, Strain GSBS06" /LENGTH=607 /DNA_ID=CAMNT_0051964659 /DNA_START=445 /DNA_END=2265 /DNA_ORIENTATION=-